MKKILMATSAIAVAGTAASPASAAAEWNLDWGGYFNVFGQYASVDRDVAAGVVEPDFDGFDLVYDNEIQFEPSITLDNGIRFGVDVELEGSAETSGDTDIDEAKVFVTGPFGRFEFGADDSAFNKTPVGLFGFAAGVNSGTLTGTQLSGVGFEVQGRSFGIAGDDNRFQYFTPRFSGFQAGVDYARNNDDASAGLFDRDALGSLSDIFSFGANFIETFGAIDVGASFGYVTADRASSVFPGGSADDPDAWTIGASLGFSGFSIAGNYAQYSDVNGSFDVTSPVDTFVDTDFYVIQAQYETGPWQFQAGYSVSDFDDQVETDQFSVSAGYNLGPGVTVGGYAGYVDQEIESTNISAPQQDAFVIGTGLKLSF